MAHIAGVNIPNHKHIVIALTAIYGIGLKLARRICDIVGVPYGKKVKDLNESELEKLRKQMAQFTIEGDLRRQVTMSIKRLMDLSCYRGVRHRKGLPVRRQRTRTNASTRKSKGKSSRVNRAVR